MTPERRRKTTLELVAESADLLETLRMQAEAHEGFFREKIREAVAEGLSVTEIAKAAKISRERVYQIRDGRR